MLKQIIQSGYNRIVMISPLVEVLIRNFYWRNISYLSSLSSNTSNRIYRSETVDFEKVVDFLKECGIGEGSIVILHSSFDNLKPTTLNREGVIDRLLELVGESGTLAAPVIRKFKEERTSLVDKFNDQNGNILCKYNVRKTKISSGVLAYTLMNHPDSVTSRFPLNPLTAVGKYAEDMMKHNLDGELPTPHGPNSCWKFCADKNAFIVHLGIDFGHHLTMQHVVSECNTQWDVKNFYYERSFVITDDDFCIQKKIKERRLRWTMFLAERNTRRDLIKSNIVKMVDIKGIPVSVIKSKELINFYQNQKKYYPYYFVYKK